MHFPNPLRGSRADALPHDSKDKCGATTASCTQQAVSACPSWSWSWLSLTGIILSGGRAVEVQSPCSTTHWSVDDPWSHSQKGRHTAYTSNQGSQQRSCGYPWGAMGTGALHFPLCSPDERTGAAGPTCLSRTITLCWCICSRDSRACVACSWASWSLSASAARSRWCWAASSWSRWVWACSSSAIWAWSENTGTEGCRDPGVRSSGMPHPIFRAVLPVLAPLLSAGVLALAQNQQQTWSWHTYSAHRF